MNVPKRRTRRSLRPKITTSASISSRDYGLRRQMSAVDLLCSALSYDGPTTDGMDMVIVFERNGRGGGVTPSEASDLLLNLM